jgi:tol-pal system protein YbgF
MRLSLFALLSIPLAAFAANKEMVELQRDVATLQDQVRALTASQTEKLSAIQTILQQTLDESKNTSRSVAVLESKINDRLERQSASVGQPVAALGAKVDQMSGEFQGLRDSVTDIGSRIGKLEQRLVDLNNAVRTIQAPPPPPAGPTGASAGPTMPAIPAATLFDNAVRDKMSGKADLALKEFVDYVSMYGDTDRAPEAQFYIGQIHYEQNDFDSAVKDFDAVAERYGSSPKAPEALLMKGRSLVKSGRKTDGAKEFRSVLSQYPRSDSSSKACTELKGLGYTCGVAAASRKKKG